MPNSLLKSVRVLHLYLGVFISPALLFFAITGGLQTFSFHETTKGSSYKPPAILVELGQLHKKQTVIVPQRKPEAKSEAKPEAKSEAKPPSPAPAPAPAPAPPTKVHNLIPMKCFFVLVAIGLFLSTLSGLYMAYKYTRRKLTITATLVAGIAIPLLLLLF